MSMTGLERATNHVANLRRPRSWPQKIREPEGGISFRELAEFAFRKKPQAALVHLTGKSASTVKYWLAGTHEPPGGVLVIVFNEIFRKLRPR